MANTIKLDNGLVFDSHAELCRFHEIKRPLWQNGLIKFNGDVEKAVIWCINKEEIRSKKEEQWKVREAKRDEVRAKKKAEYELERKKEEEAELEHIRNPQPKLKAKSTMDYNYD